MSRHTDPFYPAKSAAYLAREDIENFDLVARTFLQPSNFKVFADIDAETGERIYKVKIITDIPDRMEHDAVHLVIGLRSALDKAVNAAARVLGSQSLKHTNFPFSENEVAFLSQIKSAEINKGPFRGIPIQLLTYLKEFRPYGTQTGFNWLHGLGVISNPAKHENLLTVNVSFKGISVGDGDFHFTRVQTIWNDARNECEIFRTPNNTPPHGDIGVLTHIALNNSEFFAGNEFVPIVREIARVVEGVILGIEAETGRLLRERN